MSALLVINTGLEDVTSGLSLRGLIDITSELNFPVQLPVEWGSEASPTEGSSYRLVESGPECTFPADSQALRGQGTGRERRIGQDKFSLPFLPNPEIRYRTFFMGRNEGGMEREKPVVFLSQGCLLMERRSQI